MRWRLFHLFLFCLVVGVLATGASEPVRAQEDADLYEIHGVKVDVSAATAAEARMQALAEGERKAFQMLLERLARSEEKAQSERFSDAEVAPLTKDFWVSEEKLSTVRYIATLNYRFRPERVRSLLSRHNIPFVATRSDPILILPVYRGQDQLRLWERPNAWWDAWAGTRVFSLVRTVLPSGDVDDADILSAQDAVAGDVSRLGQLMQRYRVDSVVVAIAEVRPVANNRIEVAVTPLRQGAGGPLNTPITVAQEEEGEGIEALLQRAVRATLAALSADYRNPSQPWTRPVAVTAVNVQVVDIRSYLGIRKRLEDIPGIERVDLVLISPERARLNIVHTATVEELANQLDRVGLALRQSDGEWTLEPRSAPVRDRS
jgi:hypothetical protein